MELWDSWQLSSIDCSVSFSLYMCVCMHMTPINACVLGPTLCTSVSPSLRPTNAPYSALSGSSDLGCLPPVSAWTHFPSGRTHPSVLRKQEAPQCKQVCFHMDCSVGYNLVNIVTCLVSMHICMCIQFQRAVTMYTCMFTHMKFLSMVSC